MSTRHSPCCKFNSQVSHSPSHLPLDDDLEGPVIGLHCEIQTLYYSCLKLITKHLGSARMPRELARRARGVHCDCS